MRLAGSICRRRVVGSIRERLLDGRLDAQVGQCCQSRGFAAGNLRCLAIHRQRDGRMPEKCLRTFGCPPPWARFTMNVCRKPWTSATPPLANRSSVRSWPPDCDGPSLLALASIAVPPMHSRVVVFVPLVHLPLFHIRSPHSGQRGSLMPRRM